MKVFLAKIVVIISILIISINLAFAEESIEVKQDSKISLVYFAADDCIYCTQWDVHEKSKLLASEEAKHIEFRTIRRNSFSIEPQLNQFPDDLKWLHEKARMGRSTPGFVVLVDEKIALKTSYRNNWKNKVLPLLTELVAKKKAKLDMPLAAAESIVK